MASSSEQETCSRFVRFLRKLGAAFVQIIRKQLFQGENLGLLLVATWLLRCYSYRLSASHVFNLPGTSITFFLIVFSRNSYAYMSLGEKARGGGQNPHRRRELQGVSPRGRRRWRRGQIAPAALRPRVPLSPGRGQHGPHALRADLDQTGPAGRREERK